MDELEPFEGMRVTQAAQQLFGHMNCHGQRKRDAFLRAAVPYRAQILAFDEFHAEEDLALDLARIENAHQVPVRQTHNNLRLVLEPLQVAPFDKVGQRGLDHTQLFHTALAVQRQIQRPHAPARQGLDQDIPTEASRKAFHIECQCPLILVWENAQAPGVQTRVDAKPYTVLRAKAARTWRTPGRLPTELEATTGIARRPSTTGSLPRTVEGAGGTGALALLRARAAACAGDRVGRGVGRHAGRA